VAPENPPAPGRPLGFIVALLVVGSVSAGAVAYLGLTGALGGTIPGNNYPQGPPACEGAGVTGNHTFSFVAGVGGGINFNGTSPGPCAQIAVKSWVTVVFSVASDAHLNHSWVLVNASAPATALPVFPNAGFSNGTRFIGIAPGTSATFLFQAMVVGTYQYICEVDSHRDLGMYGWFNVTARPTSAGSILASGPRLAGLLAGSMFAGGPNAGLALEANRPPGAVR